MNKLAPQIIQDSFQDDCAELFIFESRPSEDKNMKLTTPSLFRQQAYINGSWVDASSAATMTITNPANGSVLGTVPEMGADETRQAIKLRIRPGLHGVTGPPPSAPPCCFAGAT